MSDSRLLNAALHYAAKGLPVFPLRPKGKEPITQNGYKAATTNEAQIRQWWSKHPAANIGIPTGQGSGWVVLDVDPRNGGDEQFGRLYTRYGPGALPNTLEQQSGRGDGGRHYVFRYQPGIKTWSSGGLELLSDGRYIVVAPSIHPSGGEYLWDGVDTGSDFDNLAELPVNLRQAPGGGKTNGHAKDSRIPAGERNSVLTSLAGTMRRRGMTPEAILAGLLAENRSRCDPPLPDKEVETIARSVGRYAPSEGSGPVPENANGAADDAALNSINASEVFRQTEGFRSFRMRGPKIIGTTTTGRYVILPSMADLLSFTRARPILMRSFGAYIAPLSKTKVYEVWEPIVHTICELARMDWTPVTDDVQLEMEAALVRTFLAAGKPKFAEREEFKNAISVVRDYRRQMTMNEIYRAREATTPFVPEAPAAVFVYCALVWVHLPSLRDWLSTPASEGRLWRVGEMREGLYACGFIPHEARFRFNGGILKTDLWVGPLALLANELDLVEDWHSPADLAQAAAYAVGTGEILTV